MGYGFEHLQGSCFKFAVYKCVTEKVTYAAKKCPKCHNEYKVCPHGFKSSGYKCVTSPVRVELAHKQVLQGQLRLRRLHLPARLRKRARQVPEVHEGVRSERMPARFCAQAWQEVPEVCQVRMPCRLQVGWPQVRAQGDQVCGEGVQGQEAEVPQRVQGVPARVQVVWVQVRDREGDVRGEEVPAWLFRKLRQVRAGAGEGVPLRIQVLSALMGSSTLTPFGRNWILTLSLLVTFLFIISIYNK